MKRFLYATAVLALIASPALLQTRAAQTNPHQAMLDTYCISCHNSRAKVGGLALDGLDLQAAADNAEVWEKALRKLRGH
jgi:mono/diheme cytochrome c family protein